MNIMKESLLFTPYLTTFLYITFTRVREYIDTYMTLSMSHSIINFQHFVFKNCLGFSDELCFI